jgi:hypothetical protein
VYGLGSVDGVKVGFHAVGPVVDPYHRDRSIDPGAQRRLQDYAAEWLPGVVGSPRRTFDPAGGRPARCFEPHCVAPTAETDFVPDSYRTAELSAPTTTRRTQLLSLRPVP